MITREKLKKRVKIAIEEPWGRTTNDPVSGCFSRCTRKRIKFSTPIKYEDLVTLQVSKDSSEMNEEREWEDVNG